MNQNLYRRELNAVHLQPTEKQVIGRDSAILMLKEQF